MHPDISVIVPVYEVEPYLPACLDSLIAQTKKEIEILVVDDGSPDNCGRICDEYAAKDSRMRVIHQENRGLSAARNAALDIAAGNYVMFADSDDWVSPTFCETAYRLITEHDADIVMFGFEHIKDGCPLPARAPDAEEGWKTLREAAELLYGASGNFCWNKIYRRECFDGIRFPEGHVFEDIAVLYRLCFQAKRIWYTPEKLYFYRFRDESIANTRTRKYLADYYDMAKQKALAYTAVPETQDLGEKELKHVYLSYCICWAHDPEDWRRVEAENALKNCSPNDPAFVTWKSKLLITFFRYCRPLFDLACVLWKRRVH